MKAQSRSCGPEFRSPGFHLIYLLDLAVSLTIYAKQY